MSAFNVSRFDFARDMALGMTALAAGRLFPTLKVPPVDLTGKVAIITGGNSGIGLQIALEMAERGSTVYLACRNISKAEEAVTQICFQVPASKGRVSCLKLDTSSLDSVRSFARNWETLDTKIDLLFHNAGIGSASSGPRFSPDGYPMVYATNLLGSFHLTHLLESHLSASARIILTTSAGQYGSAFTTNFSLSNVTEKVEPGFHLAVGVSEVETATAYMQTKAMQVAFAKLLQHRFDRQTAEAGTKARRIVHAFHPGFVKTPIFDKTPTPRFSADPILWLLCMTISVVAIDASQGAATGVWLACTNEESVVGEGMGGGYWDRMNRRLSKVDLMSKEHVERFWVRWEADAGVQ